MNPEHWRKVKSILEKAIEIAPASRSDFFVKVCGADVELRREVESLLDFEAIPNDLLEKNAFSTTVKNISDSNFKSLNGKQIGNYKIVGELGAGGMGAVFLAERADGEFKQQVALKLIKRGMDSDAVLRRFINERQILASLKHPNIAHLIDGGTTGDGLPYFVMEYVAGEPLIEYAENQNLDLEERLKLFREVCTAIAFAHRNLVIHRDLKPSNVLITSDGTPKLLDFGIAKLLKTKVADETATRNFVFTPEYASPEQIKGEKLTTATDVYSLGVILYELLTGSRPFKIDRQSIGEIIKSVCETEPARPSSIVRRQSSADQKNTVENNRPITKNELKPNPKSKSRKLKSLRGDLDNIILKSLRKEPERRHSSVELFSEDVRLYLASSPVSASRDTWNYRARKFIRRNRLTVGFAALILLSLVGGIAATTWQAARAEREQQRAERRFKNLRRISNSLINEVHDSIRDLPGSLPARQLLVSRAVEQLDALAAESEGNTDLQLELVWAYQNLGALPDKNLRERQEIYEKAVALCQKVIAAKPDDYDAQIRLAMVYLDLIYVARMRGDVEYTVRFNQKAVEIVEEAVKNAPNELKKQDDLWTVYYHYALTLLQLGRAEEAAQTARKILPMAENLYRADPPDTGKYNFMRVHLLRGAIANALSYLGKYEEAEIELRKALEECQKEIGKHPHEDILRRNEANLKISLATLKTEIGEFDSALDYGKSALLIREKMLAENPNNYDYQIALADAENAFGQTLARFGKSRKAISHFRRALNLSDAITAIDAGRGQTKITAARNRSDFGNVLILSGETVEGIAHLRQALNFFAEINAGNSLDANVKRNFAVINFRLGSAILKSVNAADKNSARAEAQIFFSRSQEIWKDLESRNILRKSDAQQFENAALKISEINFAR